MASSTLKGLVANSGKLGYQLWHRPLKMASLVYEREIGTAYIHHIESCLSKQCKTTGMLCERFCFECVAEESLRKMIRKDLEHLASSNLI